MIICTECGKDFKVKSYYKNKYKCPYCDGIFRLTDYKAIRWINGIIAFVVGEITVLVTMELKNDYFGIIISLGIIIVIGIVVIWLLQKFVFIKLFNQHFSKLKSKDK